MRFFQNFSCRKVYARSGGTLCPTQGLAGSQTQTKRNTRCLPPGHFEAHQPYREYAHRASAPVPTLSTRQGKQEIYIQDSTPAEIDFVIQTDGGVIPIEVKAEENVRSKSMSEYIRKHPQYAFKGLRLSMLGYKEQDWMENVPLFGGEKYFKH